MKWIRYRTEYLELITYSAISDDWRVFIEKDEIGKRPYGLSIEGSIWQYGGYFSTLRAAKAMAEQQLKLHGEEK